MNTFYPTPQPTEFLDSDGDGVSDEVETALLLDPTDPSDALADEDADRLLLAHELVLGTKDSSIDSDGDSVSDWDEVFIYQTDPALFNEQYAPAPVSADAAATSVAIEIEQPQFADLPTVSNFNRKAKKTTRNKEGEFYWTRHKPGKGGWRAYAGGTIEAWSTGVYELNGSKSHYGLKQTFKATTGTYKLTWNHRGRKHYDKDGETLVANNSYTVVVTAKYADGTSSNLTTSSYSPGIDSLSPASLTFALNNGDLQDDATITGTTANVTIAFIPTEKTNTTGSLVNNIKLEKTAILPVEVIIVEAEGAKFRSATELKVAKMKESLNASGTFKPSRDLDRFYIRIKGGAFLPIEVTAKISTTESGEYNDNATTITFREFAGSGDLYSEPQVLVTCKDTDKIAGNNNIHTVNVGGKVLISDLTIGDNTSYLNLELPVQKKEQYNISMIFCGDTKNDKSYYDDHIRYAKEIFAQVNVATHFTLRDMDFPSGVDSGDVENHYKRRSGGRQLLNDDTVSLYEKASSENKLGDITVFLVPNMQGEDGVGISYTRSTENEAHNKLVMMSDFDVRNLNKKFTLSHEIGHHLMGAGHYGTDYSFGEDRYVIEHNLMRNGTSQGNDSITSSKRIYKKQYDERKSESTIR